MIRSIFNIISFPVLIILFLPSAMAQSSIYNFSRLSLEDGLSQSTVSVIFQDSKGFLWFGTANGLNKFDGYNFSVYKHNPADSNSLSNDMINSITEDDNGMLWIGTEEGLNKFDPVKEKVVRYTCTPNDPDCISNNKIYSLASDKDGNIWIGTSGGGLNKYDPASNKFFMYGNDPDSTHDSSLDFIRCISIDKDGNLWLATLGGLSKFNPAKNKFYNFYNTFIQQNPDFKKETYALTVDDDGIIWFGTDGSLNKFDPKTNMLASFISGDRTVNSYFRIWTLLNDSKNNIWIGTGGNGIHLFNKSDHSFKIIRNNPYKPLSLSENSIMKIFEDRGGVIWVGTSASGINKFIGNKSKFRHFKNDPENPNSIGNDLIYGIAEDRHGFLWIGTLDGLNRIDKDGNVTRYRRNPDCSNCLSSNTITDIIEDKNGAVWIATRWGLNKYDRRKNNFKIYKSDQAKSNWLNTSNLSQLYADENGLIWIGTFNYGLQSFDPARDFFKHYYSDPAKEGTLSSNHVLAITEDNNGNLLIGTDKGLNVFDKKSERVTKIYRSGKEGTGLSTNYILSVYCDDDGIIWLGTYGGGLNKISIEGKITVISETQGLPNNVVYGILPDDEGNLWLSTNKGLVRFNKKTNQIRVYDPSDGLQSYEFNSSAFFRSSSGEMFFGGVNGYNSFYPHMVKDNPVIPPVVITSVKAFHKEIAKNEIQVNAEPASLSYNENFISFDFVSLDYTNPPKNKYSYKLIGFDKEWVNSGNRRFATYTNLEPGKYTFIVKGSNGDEVWNETGASFSFIILPPFWQTWWFYILSAASLIALMIFIHKYRLRMKLKQLYEIEQVRKKIADDFHDELGHKLTKISLYSELMKKDMNGNLKESENYLQKINNAANSLFDDTKDFIWSLDPVKDSLYDLAVYLKDFGDELFDKTGIAFRVHEIPRSLTEINLPMDWKRQLTLIFKEAMNNCLRHSSGSNIQLLVALNQERIEIILTDDGKGFISENGSKGRGINNMKARAAKIGGELIISSTKEKGTIIIFKGESINFNLKMKKTRL